MGGSGSFNAWRSTSPDNDANLGEVTSRRLLPVKSPVTRRQNMSPRAANKESGITMAPPTTSQGGWKGGGMLSMSTRALLPPSGSGVVPYCKPPPNTSLGGQGLVAPPEGQPREWDVVQLGKMIHIQLDLPGVAAGPGQEGDARPLPPGASPDPLGLSRGLLSPTSDMVDNLDVEYYVASDSHQPMPPPSSPVSSPAEDKGHQQPARRPGTSHAGAQARRQGTAAGPKKQARGAGGAA